MSERPKDWVKVYPQKDAKSECPAVIEGGVCFATNSDPSCSECKRRYQEYLAEKNKKVAP